MRAGGETSARGRVLGQEAARHASLLDGFPRFDLERSVGIGFEVPQVCAPRNPPAASRLAQPHAQLRVLPAVQIERLVESTGAFEGSFRQRCVAGAEKGARIVAGRRLWPNVDRSYVENRPA